MSASPPAIAVCEAYRDLCAGRHAKVLQGVVSVRDVCDIPSAWMSTAHLTCIGAQALLDLDRPDEAVTELREFLAHHPASTISAWRARAAALLASAEADCGQTVESLEHLAEAVVLAQSETWLCPSYEAACMEIIAAHGRLLLFEQAEEFMRRIGASVDGRSSVRSPAARSRAPRGVPRAARDVPPPIRLDFWAWTFRAASFLRRQALLRILWAARLEQVGQTRQADHQYAIAAGLALRMERLAALVPDLGSTALAIEIYTAERLGQPDLARAAWLPALMAATGPLDDVEWALARMAIARVCSQAGEMERARRLLAHADRITEGPHRGHYNQLVRTAVAQLASQEEQRNGTDHPAGHLWSWMHQAVLEREWQERTALLADLRNRTERRRLAAHRARTRAELLVDPLTGLGNRRRLAGELDQESSWSALFLDLDNFKQINDRCGHDVGDEVLRAVARILRSVCRAQDVLVRYGGDEFVVLMEQQPIPADEHHDPAAVSPLRPARALAERILTRMRAEDWTQLTGGIPVTASIGVARGRAIADALNRSDAALRAAKRAGRDALVQW